MLAITDYHITKFFEVYLGISVILSSHNYPSSTYADAQWVVTSTDMGAYQITLTDFNISTFAASLTVGNGSDFQRKLLSFGSRDLVIPTNETVIIKETTVWIWFHVNDPAKKTYTQSSNSHLTFDSFPSANGIQIIVSRVADST